MARKKHPILGNFSPQKFLQDYWQKKPCLIRQALPGLQLPLTPEELAGLACEDGVEARLVMNKGRAHAWQVKYGPLGAADFKSLPKTHWTLLVQGIEHRLPEINALLKQFRFVPNWRIDDVMISYAAPHGSVGPHLDSYDVFLLQQQGQRRWQINASDYTEKDFIPDLELRIIDNFRATAEWVLEPGDMLYLPPGVAHNGIALDPCMTLSIGFLAPSRSELITGFIDDTIFASAQDTRFADPDRRLQKYPGEICKSDLNKIVNMMRSTLADDALLEQWFGRYITRRHDGPENSKIAPLAEKDFRKLFRIKKILCRRNGVRSCFVRQHGRLLLYINGESITLTSQYRELAVMITEHTTISHADLKKHAHFHNFCGVLCELYNKGIFDFQQGRPWQV